MSIVLASVFGSSQYSVVSELIARGQIDFISPFFEEVFFAWAYCFLLRFAFICILLHYMLGLVSKSEVMKRTESSKHSKSACMMLRSFAIKFARFFEETGKEMTDLSPN